MPGPVHDALEGTEPARQAGEGVEVRGHRVQLPPLCLTLLFQHSLQDFPLLAAELNPAV